MLGVDLITHLWNGTHAAGAFPIIAALVNHERGALVDVGILQPPHG